MDIASVLASCELFQGVDASVLASIAACCSQRTLSAGAVLVEQGEPIDALCIVVRGELEEIRRDPETHAEIVLRRIGSLEFIGAGSAVGCRPRAAKIRAREATQLLQLSLENFRNIAAQLPGVGLSLARQLALQAEPPPAARAGVVDLARYPFNSEAFAVFPERLLRMHRAIPLHKQPDSLTLAMVDPHDRVALNELQQVAQGLMLEPLATTAPKYQAFLQRHASRFHKLDKRSQIRRAPAEIRHIEVGRRAERTQIPGQEVIEFLDNTLQEALMLGASDIHFETRDTGFFVRLRVDGQLRCEGEPRPVEMAAAVIARIKVLARMDVSETRLPQDGRFGVMHGAHKIEFRVSTVPNIHGEKAVLRVLDAQMLSTGLDNLILAALVRDLVGEMVRQPYGLLVVSGPTSSGKTTTLYSIINEMDRRTRNIVTVEDPVEYALADITQTQIQVKNQLGFPQMVRALLRQNPDVILVGEIRDAISARASAEAAMTGHLVLTSLHANDAVSSAVRLRELDVEASVLANALLGVLNQRLVRRTCPYCREPLALSALVREQIAASLGADVQLSKAFSGPGCGDCLHSGFRGRVGVFELLRVAGPLREAIVKDVSPKEMRQAARASGLIPRRAYAGFLINRGLATPDEVLKTLAD